MVLIAGVLLLGVAPGADGPAAPTVKKLGKAIAEYRDARMHAVIAYEYSHRYHSGPWMFVDVALVTEQRLSFDRTDFTLMTSENLSMPVATERRFIEDAARIQAVRQNATIWNRNLSTYFVERDSARFRFFALPGDGVVTDSIVTYEHGVAYVTLFFNSPEGHWNEGTYRLTIDNGRAHAILPIELK